VIVETLIVGPFQVNTYVLHNGRGSKAVVIDPGADPEEIADLLSRLEVDVTHIVNTHGHGDHVAANGDIKGLYPDALICIHPRDAHMLADPRANLSLAFGFSSMSPKADVLLEGNTELEAAGMRFEILHVPGHTAGSICLVPVGTEPVVFSGDTLFAGGIGRTDFPGGNTGLLIAGIREKLLSMPDETIVYPGHGVKTTVGVEKRENPFVGKDGTL
jgi:glyoxylase-like metal-dependent hydrolase (beta-lactamase superfamily II)